MEIREIPLEDDVMRRHYDIFRAAALHGAPDAPMWSLNDHVLQFLQPDEGELVRGIAAYDGDAMVGASTYVVPLLDNAEKAFIDVAVEPKRARRGIGSALVDHLVELANDDGRTVILAQAAYPFDSRDDHPYRRFAEKNGFRLSLTQTRHELSLPVKEATIQGWIEGAAPHHRGYEIQTFAETVPDHLLDTLLHLLNQLSVEAPQGDVAWEAEGMTPEGFEQKRLNALESGRHVYFTVATAPDGDVVAHSTLSVPAEDMPNIHQWGTLVRKDHRGHRLGLAVKARSLLEVQRRHPERQRITTTVAEVNAQMLAINALIGFEAVEVEAEFQRLLG